MATKTAGRLIAPELLDKTTRLDIRARMAVEGFLTGIHRSPFHGSSVEFAEHREYVPGDDTRHIDWKLQARTNRLFIKQYEEETNLTCTVVLDTSGSMEYGENGPRGKLTYASTLAASLAVLLQRQQDAVGLTTFDDDLRLNFPPGTQPGHLKQMLAAMEQLSAQGKPDLEGCLARVAASLTRRGMVVLISDLLDDPESIATALRRFRSGRQEVVVFQVLHEDEANFDFKDNIVFEGIEEAGEMLTEPPALRKAYLAAKEAFQRQIGALCSSSGIDFVPLDTTQPLDIALSVYLTKRDRAIRRRTQ